MLKFEAISLIIILSSFALRKRNTLTLLITLEIFCVLVIVVLVLLGLEGFFAFLVICVGACEAAVGLGTLIRIIRTKRLQIW